MVISEQYNYVFVLDFLFSCVLIIFLGWNAVIAIAAKDKILSARVQQEKGTVFLPESLMALGYARLRPLIDYCVQHNLHPNTITWVGSLIGMASGLAVSCGFWAVASACLLLSGIGDVLDGGVARKQGRASKAGAMLDSLLDRYVECAFMLGVWYRVSDSSSASLAIILLLFGSLMVTYSTAKAEALQVTPPRGFMKRSERMVYFILIALLAPWACLLGVSEIGWVQFFFWPMAIVANVSAVLRFRGLYRTLN